MKALQISATVISIVTWLLTGHATLGVRADVSSGNGAADSNQEAAAERNSASEKKTREQFVASQQAFVTNNEYLAGEMQSVKADGQIESFFIQVVPKYIPPGGIEDPGLYGDLIVSWKKHERTIGVFRSIINPMSSTETVVTPVNQLEIDRVFKGAQADSVWDPPILDLKKSGEKWEFTGLNDVQRIKMKGYLQRRGLSELDQFVGRWEGNTKDGEHGLRLIFTRNEGRFLLATHRYGSGEFFGRSPCMYNKVTVRMIGDGMVAGAGGVADEKESWTGCMPISFRAKINIDGDLEVSDYTFVRTDEDPWTGVLKKVK